MAQSIPESANHQPSDAQPTGEEFASRLFTIVMFGICAVILLMAVFANW